MAGEEENPIGRFPTTGIDILVIGGGVGGLFFAIEAVRNGHSVRIIEAKPEDVQAEGDYFVIGPSAIRSLRHWPAFGRGFEALGHDSWCKWNKHTGKEMFGYVPSVSHLGRILIRRDLQHLMLSELRSQGVEISYGDKVVEYTETAQKGGVRLENGKTLEADLVVAADGVHSRSWNLVAGTKDEPVGSGFSIFRASMTAEQALGAGEAVREKYFTQKNTHETLEFLMGPDTHANIVFGKGRCCWLLLHKDSKKESSSESWANTITPQQALNIMDETPGWDPIFKQLVAVSPPIVDWRLMMRNPQPNWVSPQGRVVQLGDSAHPFLPTSANGATQAMEDGISLAACLRLGKNSAQIPDACRVHNTLRFERVSCSQLSGLINREKVHKTDWDAIAKDPSQLRKIAPGKWIGDHDVESYTLANFKTCLDSLKTPNATPFVNTNGPPGYIYEPWDVLTILANADKGIELVASGDWS